MASTGNHREIRLTAEAWNATVDVGTPVRYWPGAREGAGERSRTRSVAWELGDGTPVVKVEGYAGGIALTHVEVDEKAIADQGGFLGNCYIDRIARRIADSCHLRNTAEDARLARIYAVLCLAKGIAVTKRDVHDAWAAWRVETCPDHGALVPFEQLSGDVQALDGPYRDAIRAAALELPEVAS
jgi:hypothetical protein